MKTKLILLVLLTVSFSCGTNNKPVSDAQKEKIKGEVKEVVNSFIKGIEEANADLVMESFLIRLILLTLPMEWFLATRN